MTQPNAYRSILHKLLPVSGALMIPIFLWGCANDSPDDLIPPQTAAPVTYAQVANIISNNCLSCHTNPPQNGAPMSLTSYELVRQAIEQRGLLDRISRPQGADGMMPLGGTRLPQNAIDLIAAWQSQGFTP